MNFYPHFPYFLTDSSKIVIGDLHRILSNCKCNGSRNLLEDVVEILPVFSNFFVLFG